MVYKERFNFIAFYFGSNGFSILTTPQLRAVQPAHINISKNVYSDSFLTESLCVFISILYVSVLAIDRFLAAFLSALSS
jgi:hypothetical protein